MKLDSKYIKFACYVLIVLILFGVLIFQKRNFKNSEQNNKGIAETNSSEDTEKTVKNKSTEKPTEATEIATEESTTENIETSIVYNAGEISNYIRGKAPYKGEKLVFLTFDDGPDNASTGRILDILKDNGVKGTFFLQGRNINDSTAEMLKRIHIEGSGIAMHSYSHDYKYLYPNRVGNADAIMTEYNKIDAVLKKYLGEEFKCKTWRYPGGHMSWKGLETADERLKSAGVDWIDWNAMNGDAEPKKRRPVTAEEMIKKVQTSIAESPTKDIAVVLMHDNKNKELTMQTLPDIIKYYKDNGYKFGIFK
ncbi:polysaccharide deacetylase family protein [Miniphocaeibacter massiliensis]|uniref:polysaccharide deacetylase family protein n=1 Tax=Miniphocaeibacter massiliensis TaxID=2041841 RepID=UPI000C07B478|nr:polysaccharide deacetylase family protein [Miniphocaeibacter massiliensis]